MADVPPHNPAARFPADFYPLDGRLHASGTPPLLTRYAPLQ